MILLLIIFELKHFLADWVLQSNWMVEGKGRPSRWFLPLFAHAAVHAFYTFVIVLLYNNETQTAFYLSLFDGMTHFCIDRIKSSPNMFGKWRMSDGKGFWILLGLDQACHHLVNFYIVWYLLS